MDQSDTAKWCLYFWMYCLVLSAFLPRSKHLLISWLQSLPAVIWEPKKIKLVTVSTFSSYIYHEVMGPDAMILVFWTLSFKPGFSLSSFTLVERLFTFCQYHSKWYPSAYLRLFIFLPAMLSHRYSLRTLDIVLCMMFVLQMLSLMW